MGADMGLDVAVVGDGDGLVDAELVRIGIVLDAGVTDRGGGADIGLLRVEGVDCAFDCVSI